MIWRCWAVIPPWLAALLLLVPLPTRDNMQAKPTRPWDVLARQVTGTVSGGGVYVRIAWLAYIEVCFARGSIRSRPLSVRRERGPDFLLPRPRRSGPSSLQEIVTFACRECGYSTTSERTGFQIAKADMYLRSVAVYLLQPFR